MFEVAIPSSVYKTRMDSMKLAHFIAKYASEVTGLELYPVEGWDEKPMKLGQEISYTSGVPVSIFEAQVGCKVEAYDLYDHKYTQVDGLVYIHDFGGSLSQQTMAGVWQRGNLLKKLRVIRHIAVPL